MARCVTVYLPAETLLLFCCNSVEHHFADFLFGSKIGNGARASTGAIDPHIER